MTTEPDIEEYAHGGSPREWEDESRPVSTDIPTPNPRPVAGGIDEVSARAFTEIFQALVNVGAGREDAERYAFAAQLALDLPARDARIRAEVAEEIARAIESLGPLASAGTKAEAAAIARDHAGKGFPSSAAGLAVPAEGSGHPPEVGRLPWPHGADPVTDAWLRSQGLNPVAVAAEVREHIDTLIRRTEGDDRG